MMDLSAIWTMTSSDLRQRLRDKSVFIFGLAVPLALITVFNFLFAGIGDAESMGPITVGVAIPDGDQVADGLPGVLDGVDNPDISVQDVVPTDAEAAVEDDSIDVAVVVPDGFGATVLTGGQADVEVIVPADEGLEEQVVTAIVLGYVDRVTALSTVASAASSAGFDEAAVQQVVATVRQGTQSPGLTSVVGETSDEQLGVEAYLVAGQTALFMFFTIGFGVISYVEERENGTLPRLQSMPIRPGSIIVAKTLVSFVLGVASTTVLLTAGSMLFGASFGRVGPIAVLVVATVVAVTSLVLLVTKVARTSEQAQIANTIIGLVLGMLGGAFFPVTGSGWLARLADLTPPAAFIRGLGITSGGGGVTDLGGPLLVMAGFLLVAIAAFVAIPSREGQ